MNLFGGGVGGQRKPSCRHAAFQKHHQRIHSEYLSPKTHPISSFGKKFSGFSANPLDASSSGPTTGFVILMLWKVQTCSAETEPCKSPQQEPPIRCWAGFTARHIETEQILRRAPPPSLNPPPLYNDRSLLKLTLPMFFIYFPGSPFIFAIFQSFFGPCSSPRQALIRRLPLPAFAKLLAKQNSDGWWRMNDDEWL